MQHTTTVRTASAVAILAIAYFMVASIATHIVSTQYDLVRDYISDYAVGPWGWIYGSAFIASFVGCVALAIALWGVLPAATRPRVGLALLALVGVTYAIDFIFPTDILAPGEPPQTSTGGIHLIDAFLGWVLFLISAFLILRGLRKDSRFSAIRPALAVLTWLAAVAFLALIVVTGAKLPIGGGVEKAFILDRNIWALLLALVAYRGATSVGRSPELQAA